MADNWGKFVPIQFAICVSQENGICPSPVQERIKYIKVSFNREDGAGWAVFALSFLHFKFSISEVMETSNATTKSRRMLPLGTMQLMLFQDDRISVGV
jgi:hypothetical protein